MSISSTNASYIACYESGYTLGNIQLQKILYIASIRFAGNHKDEPLIDDEYFYAWKHGPVLPKIYKSCYKYGSGIIEYLPNHNIDLFENSDEYKIISETVKELKNIPVYELVAYTNDEIGAWHHARGLGDDMPILPEDFEVEYSIRKSNNKLIVS